MSILIAASVIPLVPIAADDIRLTKDDTFVSEEAQTALEHDSEMRVLCLDMAGGRPKKVTSTCLTEGEWNAAIALTEAQPKKGPNAFIPNNPPSVGGGSRVYGLSSSPSTFRSR